MKSTPLYYPLDPNTEIEITLRIREYNGIDNDPAVIVREPTLPEAMALAGHLPEKAFMKLTTTPDLDYPVAGAFGSSTPPAPAPAPTDEDPLPL